MEAGELAQCDFCPRPSSLPVGFGQSPDGEAVPAGADDGVGLFTGLSAVLVPSPSRRRTCSPWWRLIDKLGAVPRALVRDGEGAVGRWRAGKTRAAPVTARRSATLEHEGHHLQARRPGGQGTAQRRMTTSNAHSCPAGSSPARPTSTPSWPGGWRSRTPGLSGCWRPADRITADKTAMLTLPPVAPANPVAAIPAAGP